MAYMQNILIFCSSQEKFALFSWITCKNGHGTFFYRFWSILFILTRIHAPMVYLLQALIALVYQKWQISSIQIWALGSAEWCLQEPYHIHHSKYLWSSFLIFHLPLIRSTKFWESIIPNFGLCWFFMRKLINLDELTELCVTWWWSCVLG